MGKIELKPCPFCGGEAEIRNFSRNKSRIRCKNDCFNQYNLAFWTNVDEQRDIAVERWNTRHERTCIIIGFTSAVRDSRGLIEYPPVWNLSCGHEAAWWKPQKCPSCGAKVV